MNDQIHVTVNEAVRRSGIGRTKLYELLGAGNVRAVKIGRRTLVDVASLRKFIDELPTFNDEAL